ncbi:MAG: glycine-rich protein [Crocinitomicaceae bacterium]
MKKTLLKLTFGLSLFAISPNAHAQCPVISCNPDTTVSTDSSMCDAIVNYSLPTAIDTCSPSGSQTFTYTGAQQTFIVPAGVTSISVDAFGAQGGANNPATNVNYGGRVQSDIAVTPGATIYVYVGGQANGLAGGFNGGGSGEGGGQGGGGASDIRIGGTTYNERVIVAGGAGGGGFWSNQEVQGGLGGGLIGGNGYRTTYAGSPGGDGGTQTSSANGTCVSFNNPAVSGGFGFGGSPTGCGCESYGGGGGWYGGAGSGNCRGGGGGSSYTDPAATNVTHTQGVRMGDGEITISWAGTTPNITQIGGLPSGSVFPIGSTTNTFIAEISGGVDTCSFNIIVADNEAPTIICSGELSLCEGINLNGTAPVTADNCTGETVTYTMTGATTGTGANDVDNQVLNAGTTLVTYVVSDAAGNQDSCSFNIIVHPSPTVILDPFATDTLCEYNGPVTVPVGTPASGVYSGTGLSGSNFDPSITGDGTFYITYTVTDSLGCVGSDSTAIVVDGCLSIDPIENYTTTVYPNPTSGKVTITIGNSGEFFEYTITTLDGKVIRETTLVASTTVTVDLNNEAKGIYLVRISQAGKEKIVKLIKD